MLKKLNHPNIVNVVDCFHDRVQENLIIILEYCPCKFALYLVVQFVTSFVVVLDGDLQRQIDFWHEKGEPIPEKYLVYVLLNVLKPLSYAHKLDVFHSDIKPENVFLMGDGSMKLGDFGICKVLASTEGTEQKGSGGTLLYMPPEAFSRQKIGFYSDIWSVGCLILEAVTGTKVFES